LGILDFLQKEWGGKVPQSFVDRVDYILDLIVTNPQIFSASQKQKDARRCVITQHVSLYYRKKDDKIELIAFIDNRSDPKRLKF